MEQLIFLLIVAAVGLLQLIGRVIENRKNAQAGKQSDPAPPATTLPTQRPAANSEEERIRKFMEALGMPTTTAPPPRVQPRQVIPETPRKKVTVHPVDPFPRPRVDLPPAPAPAPVAAPPPAIPPAPPPLPPRQTTVFAQSSPKRAPLPAAPSPLERDVWEMPPESIASESQSGTRARPPQSITVPASLAARLATQQGLRDAMVLREIFGPPRSLQPLERQTVG